MRGGIHRFSLAAVALLSVCSGSARAEFLAPFTGHSQFGAGNPNADGVVNFAVYRNTDGDWTDDFGRSFMRALEQLSHSTIDRSAPYVYFYQVVNSAPAGGNSELTGLLIARTFDDSFTSFGFAEEFVFAEQGSAVGPRRNQNLGDENTLADVPGDHTPTQSGVALTAANAFRSRDDGLEDIEGGRLLSDFLLAELDLEEGDDDDAPDFSSLFFGTSNLPPQYQGAQLTAEGGSTNGGSSKTKGIGGKVSSNQGEPGLLGGLPDGNSFADVPAPSPEPATLALVIAGAPLALGWLAVRRGRAKRLPVRERVSHG